MDRPQSHRRSTKTRVRPGLVLVLACIGCVLSFGAVALGAASFSDRAGDNNAAPDVTGVTVSESAEGILTVSVTVANYQALPVNGWVNLWFDLDNNPRTGDAGDEALLQHFDDGGMRFHRWVGSELVRRPATGMAGAFAAGVLTITLPRSALDSVPTFGVLAVGLRAQDDGDGGENVAADYAPDDGRARYVSPGPLSTVDAAGDQDAAPDITDVAVSDTKAGRIRFAVATPSHTMLPPSTWIELDFDVDRRRSTGDAGVEAYVAYEEGEVYAARWSSDEDDFVQVRRSGVTARSAGGMVTFDVPRSFLAEVASFDFYFVSGDSTEDEDNAIDFAPNGNRWWRYALANKPPLRLVAGAPRGTPTRPIAGRRFTVSVPVLRSDTARGVTSGSVACDVRIAGVRVSAAGRVRAGQASCSVSVPKSASGAGLRGSMTVRSGRASVTARFAFAVRR
jgi:hypothetical protein